MSYRILSSNVILGDANVGPEYALVAAPDGSLQIERTDGNAVLLDIAGNVDVDHLNIASLAAENVVVATDSTGRLVLTGFDANGLGNASALTTGVLPSGRLQGSYTLDNLVASGTVTANTLVGNLSASQLTTGSIPAARLAGGSYTFDSLQLSSNLSAAWLHANIDAGNIVTGTLPSSRLAGDYTFGNLVLSSNLSAAWLHANIDAGNIVTGTISDDRLSGNYTFDRLTVSNVTTNVLHIPSLLGSNILTSDANGYIVSSNVTISEAAHLSGVTRPIQTQINELSNGNIVGSNITNLDANNISLGILPDERLVGDYSFANLDLSGNLTAAYVHANIDASRLVSGTLPSQRLAGDYTVANLVATGNVTASTVSGNIDASRITSGIIDPDRFVGGAYTFTSLDLSGNVYADTLHANIHAANITSGIIDVARLDLDGIQTNIVPLTSGLTLGSIGNTWSNLYANTVHVDAIDLSGNIVYKGNTVVVDLEQTHTNIVPTSSTQTIGTSSDPWSHVYANTMTSFGDVSIGGTLLNVNGTPYLDLGNVETNVLPLVDGLRVGTAERPWYAVTANTITASNIAVDGYVQTSLVPGLDGLDLGNSSRPWGTVWADQVVGNVDAVNVYGELDANIVFVGGSIDDFVIKAPSGTESQPGLRFLEDESVGLYLPQSGTMGIATNNTTVLTLNTEVLAVSGNMVPSQNATYDLGSSSNRWRDVYISNSLVAGNVVVSGGEVSGMDTLSVTGNVTCGNLLTTGTITASSLIGNLDASFIQSGTIDPARIAGDLSLANLDVAGTLAVLGTTTIQPSGHVVPASNLVYDLGNATNVWRDLYLSGSTIHLGNATIHESAGNVVISKLTVNGSIQADSGLTPPLSISNVQITDNAWTVLDDTAVPPEGGYLLVNGQGFGPGTLCKVGTTNATSTSYVSASQLRCIVPAKASGSYDLSVIRGDTVSAVLPSGITYSNVVTWISASNLGNVFDNTAYTIQLQATSDSQVTYSNIDPLPPQTTLDSNTGNLVGNITSVTESTVYSFGVRATDQELQDAILTCLLYYIYVALTSVQLSDVSWAPITQTALDSNSSGYLVVTGQGLDQADDVLVGGTSATSFTKVGSTSLRVAAPSKPQGTYDVSVVYGGNQTSKTLANAVYYSDVPVWSTSAALGNVDKYVSFNFTLEATSDSNIILYANTTALPPQTTLNSTTGALTGNITTVSEDILYSIGIRATDEEYQYANQTFLLQLLAAFKITSIWSGPSAYQSAAISRDGELYMWGRNDYGQLGLGHATDAWLPTRVTGGSIAGKVVTQVALGAVHTLVLCSDNTVHSCGYGYNGQLGNAGTSNTSTFVEITNSGALSGVTVVSLAAGNSHSLARSSVGLVFGFGYNGYHELGLGDTTQRTTPVAITAGGLSGKNVISIGAGANHSVALADDGSVWAWGYGAQGQIGNGGTSNQSTPLNVSGYGALNGKTIVSISAGSNHNLALASDSSVLSWGQGNDGQIGDGTIGKGTDRTTAVDITNSGALNGRTITKVFTGGNFSLALASDGTVIGWGYNGQYQLLDSTTTNRPTPQIITPLNGLNIASIAARWNSNIALSTTNEVYSWAYNSSGQVGNGTTTTASTLQTITNNFSEMLPPNMAAASGSGVGPWTLDGYIALASSYFVTEDNTPKKAFNRTTSTDGQGGIAQRDAWIAGSPLPQWLSIQLPTARTITFYQITSRNIAVSGIHAPYSWEIQASNNGSSWTTIDTRTNDLSLYAQNKTVVFSVASPGSYTHYRIYVTNAYVNGAPSTTYVAIGMLNFFASVA
jgi:alpha-tubulin suppressor-like RCC1 family protein